MCKLKNRQREFCVNVKNLKVNVHHPKSTGVFLRNFSIEKGISRQNYFCSLNNSSLVEDVVIGLGN